jgi:hypothetical protein
VLQLSLEYVSASLENAPTYQRLKPNLENILFQVCHSFLYSHSKWSITQRCFSTCF